MAEKKYAGFGVRFVAALIDGVIFIGIGSGLQKPWLAALANALYEVLLWVNWNGQTIGKKVMKIKVVGEKSRSLDYGTATVRYLSQYLSFFVLCLGFLWVIWDKKKQGWHDKIAGTLVVKE